MAKISARGAHALAKWARPSTIGAGTDMEFGTAMLTLRSDGALLERLYSGGAYRIVARVRVDRADWIDATDRYARRRGYARVGV